MGSGNGSRPPLPHSTPESYVYRALYASPGENLRRSLLRVHPACSIATIFHKVTHRFFTVVKKSRPHKLALVRSLIFPVEHPNSCEEPEVNTENTSSENACQEQTLQTPPTFTLPMNITGLRLGTLLPANDARCALGISRETWQLWKQAKMRVLNKGTNADFVLVDDIVAFLLSDAELPKRPSVARKQRQQTRKKPKA